MKTKKSQIGLNLSNFSFTKDGVAIKDKDAREIWDASGSADWSQGAFAKMTGLVMGQNNNLTDRLAGKSSKTNTP